MFQIPLLLALALTGASVGANAIGQRKQTAAVNDTMAAERRRQKGFDKEAFAINADAQDKFKDFQAQQDAKTGDLAAAFNAPSEEPSPVSLPPSSSNITVQRTSDEKAKSKEYTDQQGEARARLMSFGDIFGDLDTSFARDATDLAGIQGARAGSQSVLPSELDAASQEGSGWRLAGDIFGGLGSVATMGALSGATIPTLGLQGLFGGAKPLAGAATRTAANPTLMGLY